MVAPPRVGSRIFMRILIVVVLPAPFAPMSANALPSGAVKLHPCSASWRPNLFHKLLTRIICESPPPAYPIVPTWFRRPAGSPPGRPRRAWPPPQAARPPVEAAACGRPPEPPATPPPPSRCPAATPGIPAESGAEPPSAPCWDGLSTQRLERERKETVVRVGTPR